VFFKDCDQLPLAEWRRLLVDSNVRPKLPDDLPANVKDAIECCWASDPSKRITSKRSVLVLTRSVHAVVCYLLTVLWSRLLEVLDEYAL
jgi:hypothetical protein